MDSKIRLKAEMAHDEANACYATALNREYQTAVSGHSRSYIQKLRLMALALLGSPFCRVTHQQWDDKAKSWLLSL